MKKSEKLFEAFTDLDDDLIENALPKEQEYDVVKPALKIQSWKPWVAGVAVAAAAFGVVFAGFKLFGSGNPNSAPAWGLGESVMPGGYPSGTFESGAFDGPSYAHMMVDWVVYDTTEELVNAADIICEGKATDISFALVDGKLYTIYDVDVTNGYKGVETKKIQFRVLGGMEDYKVEEQLALAEQTGDSAICVMEGAPEIRLGEEYLFLLAKFDGAVPSIINNKQTAIPLQVTSYKDVFCGATANDILECLGVKCHVGDDGPYVAITHDGQIVSLTDTQRIAIISAVRDALVTDCLPENQLSTLGIIPGGYNIDLVFEDINAPLYDGAYDKMARVMCDASVYIGENNKASYIFYSYTYIGLDGSSEYKNGGTYFLGEKSRDSMLAILTAAEQSQIDGVYAPEMLFDYYNDPENLPKQYGEDFTLPEFPGVVFSWTQYHVMDKHDNDKWELFAGNPVWGVYLYDLNGDGKREICSTVSVGSGIVDDRIYVCDYANGKYYELEGRGVCNYSLRFHDGVLMYVQSSDSLPGDAISKLTLGDMTEVANAQITHHAEDHTTVIPTPPTTTTTTATTGTHHDENENHH